MRQRLCFTLAVATLAAVASHAQDVRQLTPGAAIVRDLAAGQSHTYQLPVGARDVVHLTVEQLGIDVAVVLTRPDGQVAVSVDTSKEDFQPETVIAIPQMEGRYTVVVQAARKEAPRGRYSIRIEAVRPATPQDAVRVEAEQAYARGRQLGGSPADWPQAIASYEAALAAFRQLDVPSGQVKVLTALANLQNLALRPEAVASAQEALRLARETGERAAIALAAAILGAALQPAGDLAGALRAFDESVAISRNIGDRNAESAAVNQEGILYGRTGDAEKAVARFERALALDRAMSDRRGQLIVLNNMGIAYRDLGEYEKSLDVYGQILSDNSASPLQRANTSNNMGNVERLLGRHMRALELHTQALVLARQMSRKELEARSLNTIGLTYFSLGDDRRALDFHREALVIRREIEDWPGQASSLDAAGLALHRLGDHEQAMAALDEALAIRRRIHEAYGERDTLRNLAELERDRGHLAAALDNIRASVDLDETLRARITSPDLRASFVATQLDKYELYIDLLQQQQQDDPSAGHAAEALQVSERARARVLLESLLDARVDVREGIDPVLLDRERSLQKQLNEASASLSRTLGSKGGEDQTATLTERVDRLTSEYQRLQTEIRQQSPHYASLTQPQLLTAADIQASVVDDETVLLEFALGEHRSWLWAVTPHTVTSFELPPRGDIEAAARSLYEQFTARQKRSGAASAAAERIAAADARLVKEAAAMSRMLLGGIASQLNGEWRGKRLAIVATGALEYLPFAALPVPDVTAQIPIVATHEIVTIPSASVLAQLRREGVGRPAAPRTVAILADPVFEASDPRVASTRARSTAASDLRGEDAFELGPLRTGFSRLPFSREEANAIASLAGDRRVFKATDFRASRATVLRDTLRGYRIVHFATHGVLDNQRPALSGLILSLFDERGAPQNGFLRLHDIYNMRLDAELVVLSACQTALGKEIKGEGLIGLTRAFMYAGAPRVVATLWQVSDLATAELMKRFYRGVLQQKLRPAAALRAAQREMAQDPRWASPYYWAGFVIQGDWR